MSLSLLKKELNLASAELETQSPSETVGKIKKSSMGTERHGMKKRLKKLNQKKFPSKKISFSLQNEKTTEKSDDVNLEDALRVISRLDKIAENVSSAPVEKSLNRRTKSEFADKPSKVESILLDEEELESVSKAFFVNSKTVMSNGKLD